MPKDVNELGFSLEEWSWNEQFCCFSVVCVPDGLVMTGFQCISVLYHLLLCCSSAECCGGPVMTCFFVVFYLRIGFFGSGVVGITSAGVLEHRGTLYDTFLFTRVLVTELTMVCAFALFAILNSTIPKWMDAE